MKTTEEEKARMFRKISKLLDGLIVFSALLIVNSTATGMTTQFPVLTDITDPAWSMVGAAFFILVAMVLQVKILGLGSRLLDAWRQQKPLIVFVIFCSFTLLWSTYELASVYEFALMLFATLAAAYFVVRFPPESVIKIIYSFGVITALISLVLLFTNPYLSRLDNPAFNGAWRGIFWHRNHMGSLMAFYSALFLWQIARDRFNRRNVMLNGLMFFLATVLVFGSWSATGIVIYFVLNIQLVLALLWLRFRDRLSRRHYLIILGLLAAAVLVLVLKVDLIFQLLRRSSTLTGRTPIWQDMLVNLWPVKPLFGYGFGALWNQEYYRILIQTRHHWGYQVYFADNGYLDLLLNTGLIGLGLFLVFFVATGIRSYKLLLSRLDHMSLIPVMLFVYVLWANISYSFLCEVDQFVWMLLVISGFLSVSFAGLKINAASKVNNPQP